MIRSEAIFVATGITDSALVPGIRYSHGSFVMESIIIVLDSIIYINGTYPGK